MLSPQISSKPKDQNWLGIVGLILAVFIPLLQANGVDVNWQLSAVLYVLILIACEWSYPRHGNQDRSKKRKIMGMILVLLSIGSLGAYATKKQYARDHADNLGAIIISDVAAKQQTVNSNYVFQISYQNMTDTDLRATFICEVAKPKVPRSPFGIVTAESAEQKKEEDQIFSNIDAEEVSGGGISVGQQDLPARRAVFGFCPSLWLLTPEEIVKIQHGEFTVYVAGRVIVPGKNKGTHVDFDFCRVAGGPFGLQSCYGHNVPHVHKGV